MHSYLQSRGLKLKIFNTKTKTFRQTIVYESAKPDGQKWSSGEIRQWVDSSCSGRIPFPSTETGDIKEVDKALWSVCRSSGTPV